MSSPSSAERIVSNDNDNNQITSREEESIKSNAHGNNGTNEEQTSSSRVDDDRNDDNSKEEQHSMSESRPNTNINSESDSERREERSMVRDKRKRRHDTSSSSDSDSDSDAYRNRRKTVSKPSTKRSYSSSSSSSSSVSPKRQKRASTSPTNKKKRRRRSNSSSSSSGSEYDHRRSQRKYTKRSEESQDEEQQKQQDRIQVDHGVAAPKKNEQVLSHSVSSPPHDRLLLKNDDDDRYYEKSSPRRSRDSREYRDHRDHRSSPTDNRRYHEDNYRSSGRRGRNRDDDYYDDDDRRYHHHRPYEQNRYRGNDTRRYGDYDRYGGRDRREIERENQRREREERRDRGLPTSRPKLKSKLDKAPEDLMKTLRAGGVYIPPFKLRKMQQQVSDKKSIEYQRLNWDALKKSINGIINKVNVANISNVIVELFAENLVRGRGLFARALMKAQAASPTFTHVYAALLAVINTKMPEIGELVLKRLIIGFRKAYKRNDKIKCTAFCKFIAHLVNQQVANEILAGQVLGLMLETPTDDSVELAVAFVKECGQTLLNIAPKILHAVFERFRSILHEGHIDKRVQYMIEGLFEVRKKEFSAFPSIISELDLVESEDQYMHEIELDEKLNPEEQLDYFHFDENFEENEEKYKMIKSEILGDDDDDDMDEDGSDSEGSSSDKGNNGSNTVTSTGPIENMTEEEAVTFKRNIYLTIMSSIDHEECAHKLMKSGMTRNHEMELCSMIIECCSQERTYLRYYGLLAQRFCQISRVYQEKFEECFQIQYSMVHRLENSKLRNIALLFSHLLYSDALSWGVFEFIKLTPTDTTSASRVFVKILFQDLSEQMGISKLNERLKDEYMKEHFKGLFPTDSPKNTRFAINYWTSIDLGALTHELREHLKNAPRMLSKESGSDSSSDSSSSSSSDDSSSSSDSD